MSPFRNELPAQEMSFNFSAIGIVQSPYKEKFAIPRQPGLVSAASGTISLINEANNEEMVRGLTDFSHIWVLFVFHQTAKNGWKPLVRPPRLGGNKKLGVLATRSTFRPNPIGMSVIKLDDITWDKQQLTLHISGLDLLDGTPILDIKPYVPYSDAILDAKAGFAQTAPNGELAITFSEKATLSLHKQAKQYPKLRQLIKQVLAQDPRPAYKKYKEDQNHYGMSLYSFNIKWQMTSLSSIEVIEIT